MHVSVKSDVPACDVHVSCLLQSGQSLKASFLPLDVELDNVSELPELLHHHQHLRLVQNFVRQWNR